MKALKFIITFIWGLPQNLLAIIMMWVLFATIYPCKWYNGGIVMEQNWSGGITLGNFIFLQHDWYEAMDENVQHEWGHVKQSWILGPLYLFVIGIPSLFWAATHKLIAPNKPYEWFYTEAWAEKLAGLH